MGYIALIIIFIVIIRIVEQKTFRWKTVIKHLWKVVYLRSDEMVSHMKQFNITDTDELSLEGFKSQIELRGKLINSILDYINLSKMEKNTDTEEETFGYGRYNLNTVLRLVKTHPETFKKFE